MSPYYAYVLRLWPEDQSDGQVAWRVALLDTKSGHRLGFGSLSALVDYLQGVTGEQELVLMDVPSDSPASTSGDSRPV